MKPCLECTTFPNDGGDPDVLGAEPAVLTDPRKPTLEEGVCLYVDCAKAAWIERLEEEASNFQNTVAEALSVDLDDVDFLDMATFIITQALSTCNAVLLAKEARSTQAAE